MKCILKALAETEYRPRPKWWGFVKDGKRYLMRYHHCMAVFSSTEVLYSWFETPTDKAGVDFAIKHFRESVAAAKPN